MYNHENQSSDFRTQGTSWPGCTSTYPQTHKWKNKINIFLKKEWWIYSRWAQHGRGCAYIHSLYIWKFLLGSTLCHFWYSVILHAIFQYEIDDLGTWSCIFCTVHWKWWWQDHTQMSFQCCGFNIVLQYMFTHGTYCLSCCANYRNISKLEIIFLCGLVYSYWCYQRSLSIVIIICFLFYNALLFVWKQVPLW